MYPANFPALSATPPSTNAMDRLRYSRAGACDASQRALLSSLNPGTLAALSPTSGSSSPRTGHLASSPPKPHRLVCHSQEPRTNPHLNRDIPLRPIKSLRRSGIRRATLQSACDPLCRQKGPLQQPLGATYPGRDKKLQLCLALGDGAQEPPAAKDTPSSVEQADLGQVGLGEVDPGASGSGLGGPAGGEQAGISLIEQNMQKRAEKKRLAELAGRRQDANGASAAANSATGTANPAPPPPVVDTVSPATSNGVPRLAPAAVPDRVPDSSAAALSAAKPQGAQAQGEEASLASLNSETGPQLPGKSTRRAQEAARAQEVEAMVSRWRSLGVPASTLFYGPDGERMPEGMESDRVVFGGIKKSGLEQALRWKEEQRNIISKKVLPRTGFEPLDSPKAGVVATRTSASFLIFGTLTRDASDVLAAIDRNLALHAPDLTAVLVELGIPGPTVGLSLVPRTTLLTFTLPEPLPLVLSFASLALCLGLSTSLSTLAITLPALSLVSIWQTSISPLCLFVSFSAGLAARTAVGARTRTLHLQAAPVFLPSPAFATAGVVGGYKGLLPDRNTALDLALAPSLASLATSAVIIAVGAAASRATMIGGIPADYIFVPADLFGVSGPLSELASSLSAAVILPEAASSSLSLEAPSLMPFLPVADVASQSAQLLMDPLVFGGLLALHASLVSLIPVGKLNGGILVHSMFGPRAARFISNAAMVAFGVKFATGDLQDGVWWGIMMLSWASRDGGGWPLRDSVTPPGQVRRLLALAVIFSGCSLLLL